MATFKRYNEDRTQKIEVTPNQLVYEMVDILKTVDPGITDEFIKSKLDGTSKYSVIKANITRKFSIRLMPWVRPHLR